jgi:16S rRNA (adenine(1408)-N(1))-methyltransferase
MERIQGKRSGALDAAALAATASGYGDILIDIGTGDGRFVVRQARACPARLVIGVDACRENLVDASRAAPPNAVFVVADALALPAELTGLATAATINFPWGSLLDGLLDGHAGLLDGLRAITRPGAGLEIRLNAGALAEAGWSLEAGAARARRSLGAAGFAVGPPVGLDAAALRACPTTWAKRLAFGRDPRAVYLRGGMRDA